MHERSSFWKPFGSERVTGWKFRVPKVPFRRLYLLNCVPYGAHVPTCFACLRAHVLTCLACLRAHVPTCLGCVHAHEPVSTTFQISESLKSKAEFSQNVFLRKSCLATFTVKVLLKNFIQRTLFFNYTITFCQVQTDISINYYFWFGFYSFDKKNK